MFLIGDKHLEARIAAIVRVPPLQRYWYRLTLGCLAFGTLQLSSFVGGVNVEPARLPEIRNLMQSRMTRATVVDVSEVKQRAENVARQATRILTIVASLLGCIASVLLLITILALRPFRTREIAILRALGASRRVVLSTVAFEYGGLGAVCGLIGAPAGLVGANLVVWYVSGKWTWLFSASTLMLAVALSILLVALVGVCAARSLLVVRPLELLRRE